MMIRALRFTTPLAVATLGGALLAAPAASAAYTVFGNGMAQICSETAKAMERGIKAPPNAIDTCSMAIEDEALPQRDLAGTYINRGVLYLARGGYHEAKQDFDSAIAISPALGEAYTNRGAALVGLQLYGDAIADIDRGLALNPGEPEKAYFNRGLAEEALDNIPAAYRDYSRAAELKPDWELPRNELIRFTVSTRRS
jgi:tetratricopeptide (TPR) repeat protein